jgi:hypothetical protein
MPALNMPQSDHCIGCANAATPQNQRLVCGCTGIASRNVAVLSLAPAADQLGQVSHSSLNWLRSVNEDCTQSMWIHLCALLVTF